MTIKYHLKIQVKTCKRKVRDAWEIRDLSLNQTNVYLTRGVSSCDMTKYRSTSTPQGTSGGVLSAGSKPMLEGLTLPHGSDCTTFGLCLGGFPRTEETMCSLRIHLHATRKCFWLHPEFPLDSTWKFQYPQVWVSVGEQCYLTLKEWNILVSLMWWLIVQTSWKSMN